MDELFVFFARNTAAALILAGLVAIVSRLWRNPPVVHLLWLVVLLKLISPPLWGVNWTPPAATVTSDQNSVGLSPMNRAPRVPPSRSDLAGPVAC